MERRTSDQGLESPALAGRAGLRQGSQAHSSKGRSREILSLKTSEMSKAQRCVAKTFRCLGLATWVAEAGSSRGGPCAGAGGVLDCLSSEAAGPCQLRAGGSSKPPSRRRSL